MDSSAGSHKRGLPFCFNLSWTKAEVADTYRVIPDERVRLG